MENKELQEITAEELKEQAMKERGKVAVCKGCGELKVFCKCKLAAQILSGKIWVPEEATDVAKEFITKGHKLVAVHYTPVGVTEFEEEDVYNMVDSGGFDIIGIYSRELYDYLDGIQDYLNKHKITTSLSVRTYQGVKRIGLSIHMRTYDYKNALELKFLKFRAQNKHNSTMKKLRKAL